MKTIYLDNAATAFPKAPGVGQAMADYIAHSGVNVNRGAYQTAVDLALQVLETRGLLCRLFNFPHPETHAVFTPGATYGLNLILKGYLRPGDHVIVGSLEHNAVMRPLHDLAQAGVAFSRLPADREGRTQARDLLPLLRAKTRLVLVSHASNVSGGLLPLAELARLCQERGLPLAVDGAQTAGHYPLDFEALSLAALAVPGHKGLLGPQGIGALLLAPDFAGQLCPLISGGTGSASDSEAQPAYIPDRFESGTQNLPGIIGLRAALSFVLEQGVAELGKKEAALTQQLLEGLEGLPLRLIGPQDIGQRVGVVSIDFHNLDNAEAAFRLEQEFGVLTRCGLHCAPNAHKTFATFPQGTVRFSPGWASTELEIEQALAAIREVAKG